VRAGEDHLRDAKWNASSAHSSAEVTKRYLGQVGTIFGAFDGSSGLVSQTDDLINGLRTYVTAPEQNELAQSIISTAKVIVSDISQGVKQLDRVRQAIDEELKKAVQALADGVTKLASLDQKVGINHSGRTDISDLLDQRDVVLGQISEILEVHTLRSDDGRISVFTSVGSTIYERSPRQVGVGPIAVSGGRNLILDEIVSLNGKSDISGQLGALLQLRDQVIAPMEARLDSIAALLINAFAEQDFSSAVGPDKPGLFLDSSNLSVPNPGDAAPGLARRLAINPAYDPALGGRASLLRDGGSAGAQYTDNPGRDPGFVDRLYTLISRVSGTVAITPTLGVGEVASLETMVRGSVSWLATLSSATSDQLDLASALLARSAAAVSADAGVQLDEELTVMLSLERSFQANGRLISTIDELYKSLLAMVA
jgi:flagellar hook-associated protein 1